MLQSPNNVGHARIGARRVVPGVVRTEPNAFDGGFAIRRGGALFPNHANVVVRKRGMRRARHGRFRHMA